MDQTVVNQIYSDLSSVLYTQESRYTVDDINNIISQYEGFMKISNQDGKDILKIIIPT